MRAWRGGAGAIALVAVLLCGSGITARASADSAGTVHFVRSADSGFDQFTSSPSAQEQAWLRAHMWRMTVWSPYFNSRTSWYPNGWVYDDAYAIYVGEELASQHPEWILRDAQGNKLYIPWGCSGGSCPQYAGDIANPAFRHYWIENLTARVAHGYRGVFIDDVNMNRQVGNAQEEPVAPIDSNTKQPMSEAAWRQYMAQFMQEVRAALPNAEIVHNVIWFADEHAGTASPEIRSELASANFINLERGANDSGLTGGEGPWSLSALLAYVDQIHALGKNVIMDGGASDGQGLAYNLAAYLLISNGGDAVSGGGQTPDNWWTGWGVNLGEAGGPRYAWSGLLRRDFGGGMVLVNPPGAPTRTISLPAPMTDLTGASVRSLTLPAASGAVLRGNVNLAPTPLAGELPAAVETETVLETAAIRSRRAANGHRLHLRRNRNGVSPAGAHSGWARAHRHGNAGRRRRGGRAHQAVSSPQSHGRHRAVLTRISGTVLHATRGTVAIEIDQRARGRWVAVSLMRLGVNERGRFMRMVRLHAAVRYRLRASYSGATGYRPSRSAFRFVLLRAR
jgi:Hypothetical glycosyl hydrolase family 15